jgi:hypothetical protein
VTVQTDRKDLPFDAQLSGMEVVDKIKKGAPVVNPDCMIRVQVAADAFIGTPLIGKPRHSRTLLSSREVLR